MLKEYFQDIFDTTKTGDATEESYYSDIKRLIENWSKAKSKKFYVTPLPRRTEAGNPDFRIWDGKNKIIGYIEAKAPSVENLELIEDSEQLTRYRNTFPNLLLTNFFEFRLYRLGNLVNTVKIGKPFIIHKLKMVPPVENQEKFLELLEQYFAFSVPRTTTAKTLAIELAKRTRFLRDNVIVEEQKEEKVEGVQTLEGFYKAFKDHLISTLTPKDFANLFAQTITYGLFAARSRADNGFNRKLAYEYIPRTIGILRDLFRFISSTDLPQSLEWIVDDIAEILDAANVQKIMHDFYKEGKGRDPIIHFYETFLAEYDPKEREKRGVYYTPEPVVSYIVRSIHKLLKEKFGKEDGFATESVTVLDPASGTLTFPTQAIQIAVEEYKNKYGDGGVKGLIKDHILKNFYAFELMMAPYAVGHLKAGFVLDELGYKLSGDDRFKLYLTNTLDFNKEDIKRLPGIFEREIAKESEKAFKVKEEIPIMVVMGNPPYSVSSTNIIEKGSDFHKFYESYKERVRKEEKNIQPLSDDYIKFLAFAHWKISQLGQGIVGMITNNSYLDGLIHRDIRRRLLEDFNEVYILNLHGNAKRKETAPDGSKDENVFDIQQGVAIILLVKKDGLSKKVNYTDLWGLRGDIGKKNTKYDFLFSNDIYSTNWQELQPKEPYYFFTKKDFGTEENYSKFTSLTEIFMKSSSGVKTHRDDFILDNSKEALKRKLIMFIDQQYNDELIKSAFKLKNTGTWNIGKSRDLFSKKGINDNLFYQYSYRPFDERWIYFDRILVERARDNFIWDISSDNPALITTRQLSTPPFNHTFVSEFIPDICLISLQTKESAYIFPLYLIENNEAQQQASFMFDNQPAVDGKRPNINQDFINSLESTYSKKLSPEEIFYYIYTVLYSNAYRQKYQESLKIDFPKIPFTPDYDLFKKFADLGKQLIDLHLLKSANLSSPTVKFYGKGNDRAEKREYNGQEKRIYINDSQYFEGIEPQVWEYYIGGYQVLDKWLKDRKGRSLSSEEVKHYCKVATALEATIQLQSQIDNLYPELEKVLIKF